MGRVSQEPLLIEVTRGALVESRHRVRAVLCDGEGRLLAAWGAVEAPVYPRSAAKPIQALPLIETGAAERYGLSEAHLALACGSHAGTPQHVAALTDWLARTGLSVDDLRCGAHRPLDEQAAAALEREGRPFTALHNNCSGKHLGLLSAARHLNEPLSSYLDPAHPAQQRWRAALADLAGLALEAAPEGVDGCGIPVLALPLAALARAFARFAEPSSLAEPRRSAALALARAMTAAPLMVGGESRLDSAVIAASAGAVLLKGGAEGVAAAALRDRGLGLAFKAEDGAARAAQAGALALLEHVGALTAEASAGLRRRHSGPVVNWVGRRVGEIRVVLP